MTLEQAIALIRGAVCADVSADEPHHVGSAPRDGSGAAHDFAAAAPAAHSTTWADFGAGTGLFTRALARLLGGSARIHAIDNDARAVEALRSIAAPRREDEAEIVASNGDLRDIATLPQLTGVTLDGALFANALHFVPDLQGVLRATVSRLAPDGRIVVVEYARRRADPWVPHPVGVERLRRAATSAGLSPPSVVAERASRYGGTIYCALLRRAGGTAPEPDIPA